jgi:hypothetical protein
MTDFADITSVTPPPEWPPWQPPDPIAEAEVRRVQIERLTEENVALARRVAELGVQCAQLAQQCARLRVGTE